ncbi:MAG: hypothetical protein ACREPH_03165, partial [Rhodanobacteraceae bacterium]
MALIVPCGAAVVRSQAREGRSDTPKPKSLRSTTTSGEAAIRDDRKNKATGPHDAGRRGFFGLCNASGVADFAPHSG